MRRDRFKYKKKTTRRSYLDSKNNKQPIKTSYKLINIFYFTMKFSIATLAAVIAASAPTVMADSWQCNGSWNDGGLKRLSFLFDGYCENQSGQCFLSALRGKGLTVHNWQAWDRGDGWWQVDFSTTAG